MRMDPIQSDPCVGKLLGNFNFFVYMLFSVSHSAEVVDPTLFFL